MIPILTNVAVALPGHLRRLVPDRGVLLDPGPRPRDAARRQPQRLPGDPGRSPIYIACITMLVNLRRPTCSTARRSAGGAQVSAGPPRRAGMRRRRRAVGAGAARRRSAASARQASGAAWRRFRGDRVGMVSLVDRRRLPRCWSLLAALGLVARDWQAELGVPSAPPTFLGPAQATPGAATASPRRPGRTSTLGRRSAGAAATPSGPSSPRSTRRTETREGRDPALRRRPARPRRARQGDQGRADLDLRRRARRAARDADRHRARRLRRLLRRQDRRPARMGLQRLHRDARHPADLRLRRGVRARHRLGRC